MVGVSEPGISLFFLSMKYTLIQVIFTYSCYNHLFIFYSLEGWS